MRKALLAVAMALVACDKSDPPPDPHYPQASQLIEIAGTSANCHKTVEPTAEQWTATSAWCEFSCVYSGTVQYSGLRVEFARPTTADAWSISDAIWTPGPCR